MIENDARVAETGDKRKLMGLNPLRVCLISTLISVVFGLHLNCASEVVPSTRSRADNRTTILKTQWRIEKDLVLLVNVERTQNCSKGRCLRFYVVDDQGNELFSSDFSSITQVYESYVLRKPRPQLVVVGKRVDDERVISILDYQRGGIEDLATEIDADSSFSLNVEIRPKFRKGIRAHREPFQVLITTGSGLASPEDKFTRVYRLKGRKYEFIGQYNTSRVDSVIEEMIGGEVSRH